MPHAGGSGPATTRPRWRTRGKKVPGTTAIPAGRYRVVLTVSDRAARGSLWSPRPDHKLPLLPDVHGFEGIRIHSGTTDRDTEGCILVGRGPEILELACRHVHRKTIRSTTQIRPRMTTAKGAAASGAR
jgi:hypothetical protein